jgi:2,4-dienoyl-CoA reductase-like NADH-dependent reductase (Old Yellow Enzyme family)
MSTSNSPLAAPLRIGDLELPNRVIMAPLTRCRSAPGRVPTELMGTYYEQRASAGLILTEATAVDPMGVGYPDTPGIWSDEQIAAWQKITARVHAAGGRIFLQLWHVGRISHPLYLDGKLPEAPSAIRPAGHVSGIRPEKAFVTPRALETAEVKVVVERYRQGAANAKTAGFDGVEIHGANGYLIDQFLQTSTNHRTDEYGGSLENRARFALEITDAVISVWGADRVGMHIAPRCDASDMGDDNPAETFGYLARELGKRKIAFLFARESLDAPRLGPDLKAAFGGPFIANQQLSRDDALGILERGEADAISWGQQFIANPDLPRRMIEGLPLNEPNPETFYGGGEAGYTDYPALESVA